MTPLHGGRVGGRLVSSVLLAVAFAASAHEREPELTFERLTASEGLAQNTATSILQDTRGFLWIGTEGGLNRYDGYGFKVFKPDPEVPGSLSGTQVWALFEDRKGVLWVGTYDGLNRFDRITETFDVFRHQAGDPTSLSDDSVRTIFEDSQGHLWIGTKRGLNRLVPASPDGTVPTHFERLLSDPSDPASLSHAHVRSIHEDGSGRLWIATRDSLDLLEGGNGHFTHYRRTEINTGVPGGDGVLVIFEASDSQLWIGTFNGGLDRFDPRSGRFEHVPLDGEDVDGADSVLAIAEDRAGRLWIGTYGGGLVLLDPRDGSSFRVHGDPADRQGLGDDIVWSVCTDRTGIVWVGTSRGLAKHDPGRRKFHSYRAAVEAAGFNYVRAIHADSQGVVWVGSRGGLLTLDRGSGLLEPFAPSRKLAVAIQVRAITEDRRGVLWVGTDNGVFLVGRDRHRAVQVRFSAGQEAARGEPQVSSLLEDRQGLMWIGTRGDGLQRAVVGESDPGDPGRGIRIERFRPAHGADGVFADDHVRALLEDAEGGLWVGTQQRGLARIDPARSQAVAYPPDPTNPSGLSARTVTAIHQDQRGQIWVATYGGGVNRLDAATGKLSRLTERDGLANNVVYGILEDARGRLWLSTNRGVSRLDTDVDGAVRFRNFGPRDGLQGTEFNTGAYHSSDDGEMFFGGVNGLNAFRPEAIREDDQAPTVVLTGLEVFNRPVGPGDLVNGRRILDCSVVECDAVDLEWNENVFAFRYAGLHFADPQANTYAFKLDGYDRHWNLVGERRIATYTRAAPGDYVFRVRAANPDGHWSKTEAAIAVHIAPPMWMTWWFRLLAAVTVLSSVVAAYRLRTSRMRARTRTLEELNQRLERHVRERLRAESDKDHLLSQVRRMHGDLERAYDATLEGWARALELRDQDTEGHTRRVTELTVELARRMGLDSEQVEQIRRGAILHDIGKMAIPDTLLRKREPLTDDDWAVIREHPDHARRFLEPVEFLQEAMIIPYAHHERWDGSGYPRGLAGEGIPLAARIFAAVDVYDALRSDRPYRSGWPEERVRRHVEDGAGTDFDPRVVRELIALLHERDEASTGIKGNEQGHMSRPRPDHAGPRSGSRPHAR